MFFLGYCVVYYSIYPSMQWLPLVNKIRVIGDYSGMYLLAIISAFGSIGFILSLAWAFYKPWFALVAFLVGAINAGILCI